MDWPHSRKGLAIRRSLVVEFLVAEILEVDSHTPEPVAVRVADRVDWAERTRLGFWQGGRRARCQDLEVLANHRRPPGFRLRSLRLRHHEVAFQDLLASVRRLKNQKLILDLVDLFHVDQYPRTGQELVALFGCYWDQV